VLRRAFEQARCQGALAWQLRAAMSLVRLHSSSDHAQEMHLLLRNTYAQFAEGFGTRDLILARRALEASTALKPTSESQATQALDSLAVYDSRPRRSQ
jgi:hypothetical protein